MKKVTEHIKRCNKWRKHNSNNWIHKVLVLIGLVKSPTMMLIFTDEEEKQIQETAKRVLKRGRKNE